MNKDDSSSTSIKAREFPRFFFKTVPLRYTTISFDDQISAALREPWFSIFLHGIPFVIQALLFWVATKRPSPPPPHILLSHYSQIAVVRTKIMRHTYLHRLIPISCFPIEACNVRYNRQHPVQHGFQVPQPGMLRSNLNRLLYLVCCLHPLHSLFPFASARCSGRDVHSPKHHSMAGYRSSFHTKSYGRKFAMYTSGMSFVKTYLCTSTPAAGTDHRSCLGTISYAIYPQSADVSAMNYGWFFSIRFHFLPDPVISGIIVRTLWMSFHTIDSEVRF
jgi:hypothetical protein